MSAFLVGQNHINALVNFYMTRKHKNYATDQRKGQQLGEILYNENVRSLKVRYGEDHGFSQYQYRYKPIDPSKYTLGELLAAMDCYDYQACETDDYEQSEAAKLINAIRRWAIREIPGYENSWGIKD